MLLVEVGWWLLAVATFGVGDAVTTVAGTRRAGLVERSPVVRRVAGREPSVPALVGLKLVAFGIALGTTYVLPAGTYRLLVPAGLTVLGVAVTAFNCWAIVVHGGPVEGQPVADDSIARADRELHPADGGSDPTGKAEIPDPSATDPTLDPPEDGTIADGPAEDPIPEPADDDAIR